MSVTAAWRIQFKNAVERVLHVQGNYTGGILEMAIVIDGSLSAPEAEARTKEVVGILKSQSEVFRNVRLNTILWLGDEAFVKEVTALPLLQMGTFFQNYQNDVRDKQWDGLFALLKKFYARSKLILVFSDTAVCVQDLTEAKNSLQPFLHRKLLLLSSAAVKTGTQVLMELLSQENKGE